ncbi:retrotransposon protein, putative, unclassified [Tanacetum coccineum]
MSTQQDIYIDRAERLAKTYDPLALVANTQTPFHPYQPSHIAYMQHPQPNNNNIQQPSFNTNYMQQPMSSPKDISDPTTVIDMTLVLMAKAFKLNNITPTNNNQRSPSNPRDKQIAQPSMNMDQDKQMLMVEDNVGNQSRPNVGQIAGNQNGYNTVQNVGNPVGQNSAHNLNIQKIANKNGNGNVVAARAEGNGNGNIENHIRCYNCLGLGHYARNCTVRPRRRDVAYLQTQLQIAQKEEAWIQLQPEEFDFMATVASTSGTQTEKAPVYDSDGSPENDNNVIPAESDMDYSRGTIEQHPATIEETRAFFESLYNNLFMEVEKVNTVNRKLKEANADLTTELARYKGQEKCFEFNQAKFDELEKGYRSSAKQITTLNEKIANLNNQLSKEKSTVSYLQEERKKLKDDFKTPEDELLDKLVQSEKKIKKLDNILVKRQAQQKQQSLYNGRVLLEKHDPTAVYDSEETPANLLKRVV